MKKPTSNQRTFLKGATRFLKVSKLTSWRRKEKRIKEPEIAPKKEPKKPVEKKIVPVVKVEAPKKTSSASILKDIVEDQNLVGRGKIAIVLGGTDHTIECKSDALFIDGLKYTMTAIVFGPDEELTIIDVRKIGNALL